MNQYDQLMKERADLITKEYSVGLTKKEKKRLDRLQCEIEKIEEPQMSESLNRLEKLANLQEKLANTVNNFVEALKKRKKR